MIGPRLEIKGKLQTLSEFRIGSGQRTRNGDGDDVASISRIVRDANGMAYIPGSSLKGVLRRHASDADTLFGPSNIDTEQHGRSVKAIFWDAYSDDASIIVKRRTSIDDDSGTAEAGRLYAEEVVAPGATFAFEIFVVDEDEGVEDGLRRLLSRMMSEVGFEVGGDTRQGLGRLRLDEAISVERHRPSHAKERLAWSLSPPVDAFVNARHRLQLSCPGPFLIVDAERAADRQNRDEAQIRALLTPDGSGPALTGSSLLGALRAAFEWHMGGTPEPKCSKWMAERAPTVKDRLFGTTAWRGQLEIARLSQSGSPRAQAIPSVKIDRFSGAPMDNALFFTEAWTGSRFDVALRLDQRPIEDEIDIAAFQEDAEMLDAFILKLTDPIWGGLELGHGANRGYGWFGVTLGEGRLAA